MQHWGGHEGFIYNIKKKLTELAKNSAYSPTQSAHIFTYYSKNQSRMGWRLNLLWFLPYTGSFIYNNYSKPHRGENMVSPYRFYREPHCYTPPCITVIPSIMC